MSTKVKDWSSQRLQAYVKTVITSMFEGILDFSEVAIGDQERYQALRSKVLRLGNDARRKIVAEIEENYDVEYIGIGKDVVNVRKKGKE